MSNDTAAQGTPVEKTPEQIAAEAAAAAQAKAQAKADAKAAKDAEKAKAKADREAEKAAKAQAKANEKAKKEADKLAAKQAKEAEAAAKVQAKEAAKQPEQNGVRRPKPETLCGKVWGLADRLSAHLGQPVPVATLLQAGTAEGLNAGNIKTEYARWRKFNGVTGRVTLPAPALPATTEAAPAATDASAPAAQ